MSDTNPFSALFGASATNSTDIDESSPKGPVASQENVQPEIAPLSELLERIFMFSTNLERAMATDRLYMEEFNFVFQNDELTLDNLQHAIFERAFMCNTDNDYLTIYASKYPNSPKFETRVLFYFYNSYQRLRNCTQLGENERKEIIDLILSNFSTATLQPDIFCGQDLAKQMLEIITNCDQYSEEFFTECLRKSSETKEGQDKSCDLIRKICKIIRDEIVNDALIGFKFRVFDVLKVLTKEEFLAEYFMDSIQPKRINVGSDYANTVLGALFNISVLPKTPSGTYDHFSDPTNPVVNSRTEEFLWSHLAEINRNIHSFILLLLKKGPNVKEKMLSWLGDCLKTNMQRGKIWNSQAPLDLNPANYMSVTDGFMINMCNAILRLCQPFTSNFRDHKVLKVDPTYCSVPEDKLKERGIHMSDMYKETCLLPTESENGVNEERPSATSYSFVTECFFMAHRTLDLGFRVAVDKLIKLNHEMVRMERTFNEAAAGGSSDAMRSVREGLNAKLSKYLSLKCQLSDPELTNNMFDLISSTCYWLSQVVVHTDFNNGNYAPINEVEITFPLSDVVPNTLKCIPEFLLENLVSFLTFLRRFNPKVMEEHGYDKLEPILTCILIHMGSQKIVKNPHLRARLAEGLESLLPYHKDEPSGLNTLGGFQREKLFSIHPHSLQIVPSLLEVFVGIEMTGQSVEFEQKFNYRRPMYVIIKYLWDMSTHMDCFKRLAEYAEQNMEAVNPPLFLRFANLLINDAIFLLDEALSNMAKIKEMQHQQETEEWRKLPSQERMQQMAYLQHVGMLARFDNILGSDTIGTLVKLTSKIQNVFTHSTMVDRIAAMLNYFLLSLVGPNQKNFKVNDPQEYSFDPKATVMDICRIYTNLKDNDAFILAISQDGRSYSPQLFTYAEDVLVRITGGILLLSEIKEIAERVELKAEEYKVSEEALAEAPDHFLDPIMSTLMTDPVILPSSKQTVDRTTIARHLLSDQTDPFNRSPLSMDQVIPNVELLNEIQQWLADRKSH